MASAFSFLRGASLPETLVARAGALGMPALALTDYMSLAGVVRFQAACARHGIQPIVGVELAVADPVFGAPARPAQLVALAEDPTGYARLCRLLTDANLARPEAPVLHWRDLADEPEGLILLTGGREGTLVRLVLAGKRHAAREVVRRYRDAFGPSRVYVEVQHQRLPGNHSLLCQLAELAEEAGLRCVATNGVQHALRQDRIIYDLMTCTRLGITVDRPHAERPRNDEACLKSATEMATLFAECSWGSAALAITSEIANRCQLSLLKGTCTAPHVPLPAGKTPKSYLHALCEEGLTTRYASRPDARRAGSAERTQLEHELAVIARLQLEEFFLCVHDIMHAARQLGIRVSGRGSAANSLVAYLLGITGVDPLQHGLLFERFLNPERQGMPDIDVDVQSDRRDELIRYVERTYTERHAAMVANLVTYRSRSALRDAAKALGFPLELVNRLTKVLPHHCDPEDLPGYARELQQIIATLPDDGAQARCLDRLPLLLQITPRLVGLPRHLSLHNGVLSQVRTLLHLLRLNRLKARTDQTAIGCCRMLSLLLLRCLGMVKGVVSVSRNPPARHPLQTGSPDILPRLCV
jgi:error-prone DNA polymerase